METNDKKYLTVEQVAEILQVHWQTVLSYIKKGELVAFRLGKGYRISSDDFEKFVNKKKNEGKK